MAHCDEYLERISAAVDGALSPAEQEKLNAHLATCAECQRLYDDLLSLHAALADLPPVEVPTGLKDRVMDAVAAEAEHAKVLPFVPKKTSRHWQRWLASAAVLAVVIMGTWSWKPWESHADASLPQVNEPAANWRGESSFPTAGAADSGLTPVTGSRRAPTAVVPQPSDAQPSVMPAPASAPLDVSSPTADFTTESADAPVEKNAVRSAKEAPSLSPNVDAVSQGFGATAPATVPAESGVAPSDDETAYGYASVGQAPEVSPTEDIPAVQSVPADFGDTIAPQSAVMPRLFSAPLPQSTPSPAEEGVLEQSVTSQEQAVNVLANYIYEFVDIVEPVADTPDVYAISSPTGVSGTVTCLGEFETAFLLDYQESLSDQVFHYSVSRSGEVFLLGQEEFPDLP